VRLRSGAPADRPLPAIRTVAELDQRELLAIRSDLESGPFE
jgi:hypothetical protein